MKCHLSERMKRVWVVRVTLLGITRSCITWTNNNERHEVQEIASREKKAGFHQHNDPISRVLCSSGLTTTDLLSTFLSMWSVFHFKPFHSLPKKGAPDWLQLQAQKWRSSCGNCSTVLPGCALEAPEEGEKWGNEYLYGEKKCVQVREGMN